MNKKILREIADDCRKIPTDKFDIFDLRQFQINSWMSTITGLKTFSDNWLWCFGNWKDVDNTPEGAALRIEWLIENGLPKNWDQQMKGNEPLCYK